MGRIESNSNTMDFVDTLGYPVDETLDAGDSAMRAGMITLSNPSLLEDKITYYVTYDGKCIRHPFVKPWDNPLNFTRDQLLALVAGLYAAGKYDTIKLILEAYKANNWKAFNSERDVPGSKKKWYPHKFWADSNPTAETVFALSILPGQDNILKNNPKAKIEYRLTDGADRLLPHHILFLYRAAKVKAPLHIELLGLACMEADLHYHCWSNPKEENQMIALCSVYGERYLKYYKTRRSDYRARIYKYWGNRRQPNVYNLLVGYVDRAGENKPRILY